MLIKESHHICLWIQAIFFVIVLCENKCLNVSKVSQDTSLRLLGQKMDLYDMHEDEDTYGLILYKAMLKDMDKGTYAVVETTSYLK